MVTKLTVQYPEEYAAWRNAKYRCYQPKNSSYKNYGERGIIMCDRWLYSFYNFMQDMGSKPLSELTLERINNDGNYEPDNCKWATPQEQRLNQRKHKKYEHKEHKIEYPIYKSKRTINREQKLARIKQMWED